MRACPECLAVFVTDPEYCSFDGTRLLAGEAALFGKLLHGHRIEGLIGLGGTGCVFRGTRMDDGRTCAIKVLFGEMATDKSIAARFEREAEAMSSIRHRNVVTIFDYGHTGNGLIYLVMEFLDGVTLKDRIEADAPLTADHAGRIMEQLTAGLAEAHRQGFVHRDLKPGNVILVGPFGREEVKILDFGIVASLREGTDRERLTKTGYIIGTPTYMAPEQVDPAAITPQVDVYALGVILYEMLTGDPPFTGTLEQILVAKMTQAPRPIEGGTDLGELVLRMLDMNPDKRPPSALHVSAELSRLSLLNDDPATVRADVPELRTWASIDAALGSSGGVRVIDRTDENDVGEETHEEMQNDEWVADTRRVDVVDGDGALLEFGEVSTRSELEPRADTVVDEVPAEEAFDQLPAMGTPTNPGVVSDEADTGEEDAAEEIPTRITERPHVLVQGGRTLGAGEAVTALDLLDNESDPFMPRVPRVDEAGDADTALDMRLDHLIAASRPVADPTTIRREPSDPLRNIPGGTLASPPPRRRFLTLGIVLAVVIGVLAAVAIVASTSETVIVDVPREDTSKAQ